MIADRMWGKQTGTGPGENKVGKGRVIRGKTPGEVLKSLGIQPDFAFSSVFPDSHIETIHRTTGEEDIYFVVNRLARHGINDTKYRYLTDLPDRYEDVICRFRVTGKVPELWNPMTGKIERTLVYMEENGCTLVPLHLNPEGSVFVVFRDKKAGKHIENIEKDKINLFPEVNRNVTNLPVFRIYKTGDSVKALFSQPGKYSLHWSDGSKSEYTVDNPVSFKTIASPWSLKFEQKWGPAGILKIDSLVSWSDSKDSAMKYYSGKALYSAAFHLSSSEMANSEISVDLGNVQEIASVRVNGKDAGVAWIAPFKLDITGQVREGENDLEITVVDSWVNRLIGDSYLPFERRFTKTNVMKFNAPDKESYLRKSGLMGDVRIVYRKVIHQN